MDCFNDPMTMYGGSPYRSGMMQRPMMGQMNGMGQQQMDPNAPPDEMRELRQGVIQGLTSTAGVVYGVMNLQQFVRWMGGKILKFFVWIFKSGFKLTAKSISAIFRLLLRLVGLGSRKSMKGATLFDKAWTASHPGRGSRKLKRIAIALIALAFNFLIYLFVKKKRQDLNQLKDAECHRQVSEASGADLTTLPDEDGYEHTSPHDDVDSIGRTSLKDLKNLFTIEEEEVSLERDSMREVEDQMEVMRMNRMVKNRYLQKRSEDVLEETLYMQ